MRCPACASESPEGLKFCGSCGAAFARLCPKCQSPVPPRFRFCGECGQSLGDAPASADPAPAAEAGRKQATVLFSDLSGYTSMSEKLDPEEVKEIMGRVFGEISQIVTRYEGFIEKFIGDAVMVLFGVPASHEDDAVRAVRTAREIHEAVAALSLATERRFGLPLRMHTGINTGLVVTGTLDGDEGSPTVTGDTINVASRLTGLATAGEIVIGPVTHALVERFFDCEALAPAVVKGKAEPVAAYRVLAPVRQPRLTRRAGGRRTRLVGRTAELDRLRAAAVRLPGSHGASIAVLGEAGAGKSRLLEEFRRTLGPGSLRWLEACCYAYTQNVPYQPFTVLFGRCFGFEEGDPPEEARGRIESGLRALDAGRGAGWAAATLPLVGSLFPSVFPQGEEFRSELWQERFHRAVLECVSAWAAQRPLVLCLEDLHWADPSSLALLRFLVAGIRHPVLFLHTARPPFTLLPAAPDAEGPAREEILLEALSPERSQELVESLLETTEAPADLRAFVQDRAEGNPFYLEEVVNTLLETGSLVREGDAWRVTEGFREAEISPTIHGIVSARIDRLAAPARRLLQEASVIGRTFSVDLLARIAPHPGRLDKLLEELEQLDLVRAAAEHPVSEYAFRHALTQEVAYRGLLRSERQQLHERIGLTLEELNPSHLEDLCEALAFHFAHGKSRLKAAGYLVKSGQKAARRFALEEAHQFYRAAHEIFSSLEAPTREERTLLASLLLEWFDVFSRRADFVGFSKLLEESRSFVEEHGDERMLGWYLSRTGFCQSIAGDYRAAEGSLRQALALGESIRDAGLSGRACINLGYVLWEVGRLSEAIAMGERAVEHARALPEDRYLFIRSHADLAKLWNTAGGRDRILELADELRTYGEHRGEPMAVAGAHYCTGIAQLIAGEPAEACASFNFGLESAMEPFDHEVIRLWLSFALLYSGRFKEAEEVALSIVSTCRRLGFRALVEISETNLALGQALRGDLEKSRELLERLLEESQASGRVIIRLQCEYYLGKVHALSNDGPEALREAEAHLGLAIEKGREIGAWGFLGMPLLDLGTLCRASGRHGEARACLEEALALFERGGAATAAATVREALATLGGGGSH